MKETIDNGIGYQWRQNPLEPIVGNEVRAVLAHGGEVLYASTWQPTADDAVDELARLLGEEVVRLQGTAPTAPRAQEIVSGGVDELYVPLASIPLKPGRKYKIKWDAANKNWRPVQ
jgi:hypothetical protein